VAGGAGARSPCREVFSNAWRTGVTRARRPACRTGIGKAPMQVRRRASSTSQTRAGLRAWVAVPTRRTGPRGHDGIEAGSDEEAVVGPFSDWPVGGLDDGAAGVLSVVVIRSIATGPRRMGQPCCPAHARITRSQETYQSAPPPTDVERRAPDPGDRGRLSPSIAACGGHRAAIARSLSADDKAGSRR
jgi:hypothetical protein